MKRAFTLIELLLALGITVIIGSILAASLWTATKASRSADAMIEDLRQTTTTGDILERELANCFPAAAASANDNGLGTNSAISTGSTTSTTITLAGPFEGLTDDIQFYTTGPEPKASVQGDLRQVEYTAVSSTNNTPGRTLVRRVAPNLLSEVTTTPPDQPICTGVDSIEFWYYDGTEWLDSWDSTQMNNTLPEAVKFTLTLLPAKQGDEPRTTTRIIPLSCWNPSASSTASSTGGTQ